MTQALVRNTTWSDGDTLTAAALNAEFDQDLEATAVATANITDAAVTTAKILDANVTTAKIADANVTTAKLATNAVTTVKITDANVTADKLASNAVTTAKITDANVTEGKLSAALKAKLLLQDQSLTLDNGIKLTLNTSTSISADGDVATKKYCDDLAIAGAADASTTVKGIVKMSTAPASATEPIAVGDNDSRITAVAGKASLALDNLASTALNADIIPAADNARTLGSDTYKYANIKTYKINGITSQELENDVLLDSTYFTDVTGKLFAWHNNGLADFSGANWNGALDLTENGTGLTVSTNQLGTTSYCNFNGTDDYLNNSDATFDTANEDLTFYAWIKPDDLTGDQTLGSKLETTSDKRSWSLQLSGNNIKVLISSDGVLNATEILTITDGAIGLDDGGYHFLGVSYDTSIGSITVIKDRTIVGHTIISSLIDTRYNSSDSDLMIGALSSSGSPSSFFGGDITEIGYLNVASTCDELRNIYAASASVHGFEATKGVNGQVRIGGKQRVDIAVYPTADATLSDSMANATGYSVFVPEANDGYKCKAAVNIQHDDANSDDLVSAYLQLYDGSSVLKGSACRDYTYVPGVTTLQKGTPVSTEASGYFAKDTNITLRGKRETGDTCSLGYSATSDAEKLPSIKLQKDM